jgi:hypothetical protein
MKCGRALLCIPTIVVLALFVIGCGKTPEPVIETTTTNPPVVLTGTVMDYFPCEVGMTWHYKVTTGLTDPLRYWVIEWPVPGGWWLPLREQISPGYSPDGSYALTLQVMRKTTVQVGAIYCPGVELAVLEDELGIFQGVKQLYWAFVPDTAGWTMTSLVVQVATIPSSWAQDPNIPIQDGSAFRPLVFDDTLGMGNNYTTALNTLAELDYQYYMRTNGNTREFLRDVKDAALLEGEVWGYWDAAFTETTVYELGKGLVYLQQKVNGQVSMTWELMDFSIEPIIIVPSATPITVPTNIPSDGPKT